MSLTRLSASRRQPFESGLALGLVLGLLTTACGTDEPPRPNVLLISLDTLRADHLHCYGYARPTSPRLDELAAQGVLFEEATSTTSWTLPAHLSLLTGLSISAHGVCDDRLWLPDVRQGTDSPLRGTFLSEVLQRAGYETAGIHTWKYLEKRFGFGPGFDSYERVGHSVYSHPEWSQRFEALRARGDEGRAELLAWRDESPELFDEQRPTAAEAVDKALGWLGKRTRFGVEDAPPWFLFLHLFDCHDDYVPPPPFDTLFDPDYEGPIDGRRVTSPDSPVRPDMDPRDLEHLIALYDGEIAWVDYQVGRILNWLDERGQRENTLIIVVSDHGEAFFEHGAKTHRADLHRESVHVPLIMSWPAGLPANHRVRGAVGLVDVAPTLYSLLELPAPAGLSGRDLSAIARGEAQNERAEYISELYHFTEGPAPVRQLGLFSGEQHTLVRQQAGGLPEVHVIDRRTDPRGTTTGTRLRLDAPRTVEVTQHIVAARKRLIRERAASLPRDADWQPLDAAELAELAAMGYGGESGAEGGAVIDDTQEGAGDRLCIDGCVWHDR